MDVKISVKNIDTQKNTGSGKILFIEDDKLIRSITCMMIGELGYDVDACRSGSDAVKKFETELNTDPYKLVIVDLMLDGEPEGHKIFIRLKELDPDVKGIMSTGYTGLEVVERYEEYGFDALLRKPYSLDDLTETLGKVLGQEK